ncbi:MAG: hypothetical protein LV481_05395 [Methylacidiphilales bacterium]|nr:hypothetical protein [Candidatus Methylacidiphilales bacterium]
MKYWLFCGVLAAVLAGSLPGHATPLDDKVAALKKAMQDEAAAKAKDAKPNGIVLPNGAFYPGGGFNPGAYAFALNQFTDDTNDPNQLNQLQSTLQQILSVYTSDAVQKAGRDLLDEIKNEQKARSDAINTEVEGVLDRAKDAILKAQKPADLDAVLQELQKAQSLPNGMSYPGMFYPGAQNSVQRLSAAYQFTTGWQDYLSALAGGQTEQAGNYLRNLSQNGYGITVIPRSEILQRIQDLGKAKTDVKTAAPGPSAEDIFNNIKTLDEMEPALRQIQAMRSVNGGYDNDAQQIINQLSQYVRVYNDVRAGLPSNYNMGSINSNNGSSGNPKLTAMMFVFIMQHYFDTFQGAAPAPDEKPQAFLNRVIEDAKTREDWQLLGKAAGIEQYFSQNSGLGPYASVTQFDPLGLNSLMAGIHQEEAGQYAQAVVSYQAALKSSSNLVPAKMIGDHLAAIQKDHPNEYDAGMQLVNSPPMPRYYPGMMPGMPYPYSVGPGGVIYNRMGVPPVIPVLAIPGATTNTPPTAPSASPKPVVPATNAPASTNQPPGAPKPAGD